MIDLRTILARGRDKVGGSLARRIIGGAGWSFLGSGVQKVLLVLSSMVCMHLLGKEGFGELGLVRSTVNMFILCGAAGIGGTATKFLAEFRDRQREKLPEIHTLTMLSGLVLGLACCAVIWIWAEPIARYTGLADLTLPLRVGSVLMFFLMVTSVQNGTLSGYELFREIAIATAIGGVGEFICIVTGAWVGGVTGAVAGYGIGFIILAGVNQFFIIRHLRSLGMMRSCGRVSRGTLKYLWSYTCPSVLSGLMVVPVCGYVKMLLARESGSGELAVYEVADTIRLVVLFIPMAISKIVLPVLSNVRSSADIAQYRNVLKVNVLVNVGVTGGILLCLFLVSPIVLWCFKLEGSARLPMMLMATSTLFTSLAVVVGAAIASCSRMWIGFAFNALWGSMVVGFTILFLSFGWKAAAPAAAFCLAYLLHASFQGLYLRWMSA